MKRSPEADVLLKSAQPLVHQHAPETQPYGHLVKMPIALSENARKQSVENLNQLLGGVSLAMAADIAETTLIPRPPKGREAVAVQISRLLHAHEIVLEESRSMARLAAASGDEGTNDLIVSEVVRRNELQAWFVAEHVVPAPMTEAR
jgi:starvation-inducible DNA-binding protein